MKKIFIKLSLVLSITIIFGLTPTMVSCSDKTKSDAVVYELKDGVLTISGQGAIPKTMKFKNNKKIKEVVIKKGITKIPQYTFYNCENLEKVKIPNTVKKIGPFAFASTAIKKIYIPKSVNAIGEFTLAYCNQLTKVTMPGEFDLTMGVDATDSVITSGCNKLDTINFNTNFNLKTASYCSGKKWNVSKNDPKYKSIKGIIYTKDGKEVVRVPADVKVLKIQQGCEVFCLQSIFYHMDIYDSSYSHINCINLTKIVLPKSIKKIDNEKHIDDYKIDGSVYMRLQKVIVKSNKLDNESIITLISSLKQIYRYKGKEMYLRKVTQFQDSEEIRKIFPKRIKKKGKFYILDKNILIGYEDNKNKIKVPKKIKTIADKAFMRKKMKKVILPNGLKAIGERAFYKCKKLEKINLPTTLKKLDSEAFASSGIKKINIPKNITSFGMDVFYDSKLVEAKLPDDMEVIPEYLFSNAEKLSKVNVPKNLKKIGNSAFIRTAVNIQSFLDSSNLRIIEDCAFQFVGAQNLIIPTHIEKIGHFALNLKDNKTVKVTIEGDDTKFINNVFHYYDDPVILNFKTKIENYFTEVHIEADRNYSEKKINNSIIRWLKVENADGYEIIVSTNKEFTKNVKEYTANKDQKILETKEPLEWGNVYVKIRPYTLVDGEKVYGKWSENEDVLY